MAAQKYVDLPSSQYALGVTLIDPTTGLPYTASGGGGSSGGLTNTELRASPVPVSTDVSRGSGVIDSGTQRVTLASDGPTVQNLTEINSKTPALVSGGVPVNGPLTDTQLRAGAVKTSPSNFPGVFRDGFDDFVPGTRWNLNQASGDLVLVDGNAAGTGYLVISKDPLNTGTSTSLTTNFMGSMPVDVGFGAHLSQRIVGSEFSLEVVSTDSTSAYTDVAISSVSQVTTTLTVDTATPHGLSVGTAISIYGVNDSRFNYASTVVASVPSPTRFTASAGPTGNLPSVTAGPFTQGYVTKRPRLGNAVSGTSMIFEGTNAALASMYVRSNSGDAQMTGTVGGNHTTAINTSVSVQAVNSPYTYAFRSTSEYRLALMADRVQWHDGPVDSSAQTTSRQLWSQVAPDPSKTYVLRVRAASNKSATIPVAKIVSMSKTGTTTATVVTETAHGLTTSDLINIYGSSDQTAYANLAVATAVASVVDSNTFTVVIGTAVTSTVYGGYVARVQGGALMSASGAIAQAAVSATLATAADGKQALTLTGSASWAGLLIGDYVNVHGLKSVPGNGADLGCDGAWKVRNIVTTSLELEAIGGQTLPANFGATVSGGAIIKRSDLRLSFVRLFDFDRLRVETLARPSGDMGAAAPVVIQNTPAVTVSSGTVTTVSTVTAVTTLTGGAAAEDAATSSSPHIIGGVVRTSTAPTTLVAGDAARLTMSSSAQAIVKPYAVAETDWQYDAGPSGIVNTTSAFTINTAPAAGLRNYITSMDIMWEAITAATEFCVRSATITCNSQTIASNILTTSAAHGLTIGDSIVPSASTVTGLTAGTRYYVLTTPSTTTLTLSASKGGTTLAISGTGVTATLNQILYRTKLVTAGGNKTIQFATPLRGALTQPLEIVTLTASVAGAVYANISGYQSA